MSIRFVFGPAGSGKSTLIQDELIKESVSAPKDNFLLIVPDQFTMQTQMDIVKRTPYKGILNIDVLSFGRLSYRVFSVTGKSEALILDDTGKSLVLRRVAGTVSEKMPYLGRNLNKIGYIHEVKSQISEFMQYGLSVKDVENMSAKMPDGLLKKKLYDLSIIYGEFCKFNKDKFITNEETLDLLCEKIAEAPFIKGATIVFDGFTGFTPIQERVVLSLCKYAKEVVVTFNLSLPETPDLVGLEEKLFYLSRKGALRLKTKASDLGIEIGADTILTDTKNGRFKDNPEFAALEAGLFRSPFCPYDKEPENIFVTQAENIETEVSDIALKIYNLIKSERYAYRDIAVITGDLSTYGNSFERRLKELGMPVFIDKTHALILNPFIEYIKSGLKMLISDFSYESVFHYLRSGFTDFDESETDCFDVYVKSLNIRGRSAYSKPFKKREKGLKDKAMADAEIKEHDAFREKLYREISVLLTEGNTASDYVRSLYTFIKNNNSYERLEEYARSFETENDLSRAREYSQVYKAVMELLDTIDSLIGKEQMTLQEFYNIFEAGISEIEVGIIPRNVDRIVVGDIERTRLSEIKVLFFAGVNDGNIPKATDKGGLLSLAERELLEESGWDLAPTPREEMYTQKLYLYMNLCKPTEKLYLSFSGTDTEGKGLRPSYLIEVIKKLFPKLEPKTADAKASLEKFVSVKDSERYYASLLRDYVNGTLSESELSLTESLYSYYKEKDDLYYSDITEAAFKEYMAKPLSEEIIKLIYGNTIKASISRMELYAGCAYAHFLKYGMGLKESEEYEFEASDLGNIYHGVLDCFSTELSRRGLGWTDFDKALGEEMVEKAVRDYCENYEQGILLNDDRSAYTITKITKIMQRTVDTLQFHLKKGRFIPESHEYSFEREVDLNKGKKMLLNGKIDRIDLFEEDNRIYVKIVDYKSSTHDIDITNVYHGIEQQLSIYMAEALYHERTLHKDKEVLPSALMYYTIDNPFISFKEGMNEESIEKEIRKELKVKGIFLGEDENIINLDENVMGDSEVIPINYKKDGTPDGRSVKRMLSKDEMANMLGYAERMVASIGNRIVEGDIQIKPYVSDDRDACKFCAYKGICRFDEKIPGFKTRDGKDISDEEARQKVTGGDGNGLYLFT